MKNINNIKACHVKKTTLVNAITLLSLSLFTLSGQFVAADENTTDDATTQKPRVAFPEKKIADINALKWRFVGPMVGNRGSAGIGHPTDKNVFFFAASNGLWKTTDAGATWLAVGDKRFQKRLHGCD